MNSPKKNSQNKQASRYIKRLNLLYSNVKKWMAEIDPEARFSEGVITLREEIPGIFKAPTLVIRPKSGLHIRLSPRACSTIGASGHLEIASVLGSELLVYRDKKKTALKKRLPDISVPPRSCRNEKGWTWIVEGAPKNVSNIRFKEFQKLYGALTQ